MNKRITAYFVSAVMLLSSTPLLMAEAADTTVIINDTFADGSVSGYEVYDSAASVDPVISIDNGSLRFEESSGWNTKNGVKKDITAELAASGFVSGSVISVSADISTSWYDNKATIFIEAGGKKTTLVSGGPGGETWTKTTLSDSAAVSFNDSDTVYLCITQPCGTHLYDNISLSWTAAGGETPDTPPTKDPSATPDPDSVLFSYSNNDFKADEVLNKFSLYDTSDTSGKISANGTALILSEMSSSADLNGFRMDITDVMQATGSGYSYTASMDTESTWWQDNPGKLFMEIVTDGETETVLFEEFGGTDTSEVYSLSGSKYIHFSDSSQIYLCYTQLAGYQKYNNITLSYDKDDKQENKPGPTPDIPVADGVVQLSSGKLSKGTFMPDSARAVYMDTFDSADQLSKYTPYSTAFNGEPGLSAGMANFNFASDWNTDNGVCLNVSEAMRENYTGGAFRIALDFQSFYWGGSPVVVTLRYGSDANGWKSADVASGIDTDTAAVVHVAGVLDELKNYNPETDEMIINITQSAGGWKIDNVAIELPYDTVKVFDIAVDDWSKLDSIKKVAAVFGGEKKGTAAVTWQTPDANSDIVYGTTDLDGVMARAIKADSAVKISVSDDKAVVDAVELDGQPVTAEGDNGIAFLVDSLDKMNMLSAVSAAGKYAEPISGTSSIERAMKASDNGKGITIEGKIADFAYNNECIVILDSSSNPVAVNYVSIGADGGYCLDMPELMPGEYTAVMTDTGAKCSFAYASADAFKKLCDDVRGGKSIQSVLSSADDRIIIGSEYFNVYDKITGAAVQGIESELKNVLSSSSVTRADAASKMNKLIVSNAASADITAAQWRGMITDNAAELGISGLAAYKDFAAMTDTLAAAVKSRLSGRYIKPEEYSDNFGACVINAELCGAKHYSNVIDTLKSNTDLLGADAASVTSSAAKYIMSNITSSMLSITDIVKLIKDAKSAGSVATGGSGGGGGGSSSSSKKDSKSDSVAMGYVPSVLNPFKQGSANGTPQQNTGIYNDIASVTWANAAINSLSNSGILNGYDDGSFRPNNSVTREEFVKLLVCAFGIKDGNAEFTDIASDRWSYSYIAAAAGAGIVNGMPDGSFKPTENITRQDAAVMVFRTLEHLNKAPAGTVTSFADSDQIGEYALDAVSALVSGGIINGKNDDIFAPLDNTTRAEAAVIVYRALSL